MKTLCSTLTLVLLCVTLARAQNQPAASNRVLELDGRGSYVQLPPNTLANVVDATAKARRHQKET